MQSFSLSYSKRYKIVMGFACLFIAIVPTYGLVLLAIEIWKQNPDYLIISFVSFFALLMLFGTVFTFLWIKTRKVEFVNETLINTNIFGTVEIELSSITGYWRLNEKHGPTLFFSKNGKTVSVVIDSRLDPQGKTLQLIENHNINFNKPMQVKNQQILLIIIIGIALLAMYKIFYSIKIFGRIERPINLIFLLFLDGMFLYSYFMQKKFANKHNQQNKKNE